MYPLSNWSSLLGGWFLHCWYVNLFCTHSSCFFIILFNQMKLKRKKNKLHVSVCFLAEIFLLTLDAYSSKWIFLCVLLFKLFCQEMMTPQTLVFVGEFLILQLMLPKNFHYSDCHLIQSLQWSCSVIVRLLPKKKFLMSQKLVGLLKCFQNVVGGLSKGYKNGPSNICIWMWFFLSYDLVLCGRCTYLLNKVVLVMWLCYAVYFIKKRCFS